MEWHYAQDDRPVGPVSRKDLLDLAEQGTVGDDTLVWRPPMKDWAPFRSVKAELRMDDSPLRQALPAAAGGDARREERRFAAGPPTEAGAGAATPNAELTRQARERLAGNWGPAVGVCLVSNLISMATGLLPFVGSIAAYLIAGPLTLGLALFFLALLRRGEFRMSMLFEGFSRFTPALGTYLLSLLLILLWGLLLIVPGLIVAYAYSMAFFVLADNPGMRPMEALRRSSEIMRGRKWKLFCLHLRFVGWGLLCLLTFGIGFLWLLPYVQTASAAFYEDAGGGTRT